MVIFYIWGTSRLRAFPAQTLCSPSTGAPIMDHWSHFTIQGSAAGYKYAGYRRPAAAAGPSANLRQHAPLYTEVDLRRWSFPS
jgi:hypothetical protein